MASHSFADFVAAARSAPITAAVIIGSGAGGVADRAKPLLSIPFGDVPGLSPTSVAGHRGFMTLADWADRRVLIFEGRLHAYEGHGWPNVVQSIHIAHDLGVRTVLATNAAGGIHPDLDRGSLMAVQDHILWNVPRPWLDGGPGSMGPSRASHYSPQHLQLLSRAARDLDLPFKAGVYACVSGPCYETPAEIRALRAWGADAVGMSTAREIQAAADLGMACAAVSCITNRAAGLSKGRLDHQEVLTAAGSMAERLAQLIEAWLSLLP